MGIIPHDLSLIHILNISPQQMKYVTHTEAGEGLIFYGNVVLPFVAVSYTHLILSEIPADESRLLW